MKKPLVSIIIPVYNGANYVGEAIDSALAQTYENIEIIIVNDGSKDGGATERAVCAYGDKVKYYAKENGGVSSALNAAVSHASGEWISWLSHDDLYTPEKVAEQMKDVDAAKNAGYDVSKILFHCAGGFVNSEGKTIQKKTKKRSEGYHSGPDALYQLFDGYGIGGCGLLMPKRLFEEIGGFEESMRYMQDEFMWEKAFLNGYGLYTNHKAMAITRIHNKQTSITGLSYAYKDREVVGLYLSEHLCGVVTSRGKSVLKKYMFLCLRRNNKVVSDALYPKLKASKELNIVDYINIGMSKIYGKHRRKLVRIYYRMRFGAKR